MHYYDGVVSHLQLDILEYEVKWALGSIAVNKASGFDGISVELFKIQRMMPSNMSANLEGPVVAIGLAKVSPHPNSQEG